MTAKAKKNVLPPLGWCNIVVSRLPECDTRSALKLNIVHAAIFADLHNSEQQSWLVRRRSGPGYQYIRDFGAQDPHPVDTAFRLLQTLWGHQGKGGKVRRFGEKYCRAHGLILHTKSFVPLDFVWTIQHVKLALAQESSLRTKEAKKILFELSTLFPPGLTVPMAFFVTLTTKTYRVFYVNEQGRVKDISRLDAGSEDDDESSWGQLSGFTNTCGDLVRYCVNVSE